MIPPNRLALALRRLAPYVLISLVSACSPTPASGPTTCAARAARLDTTLRALDRTVGRQLFAADIGEWLVSGDIDGPAPSEPAPALSFHGDEAALDGRPFGKASEPRHDLLRRDLGLVVSTWSILRPGTPRSSFMLHVLAEPTTPVAVLRSWLDGVPTEYVPMLAVLAPATEVPYAPAAGAGARAHALHRELHAAGVSPDQQRELATDAMAGAALFCRPLYLHLVPYRHADRTSFGDVVGAGLAPDLVACDCRASLDIIEVSVAARMGPIHGAVRLLRLDSAALSALPAGATIADFVGTRVRSQHASAQE